MAAIILWVIAALCYFVALFERSLGEVDLITAGHFCVALGLAVAGAVPVIVARTRR